MKKHHWFDFVEYLSLIGVGTGTILSIVSKQFLYSSAPMSLALLIGFANRRRVEQAQEQQLADSLSNLEQKLSKNLELVDQQMQNMPTPEMIGDVRQSILRHNRDSIKKLHAYTTNIKREVENRFNSLDQQNLSETREEISQLQLQYAELYNSLTGVSTSLRQVATAERVDEIDQAIAKLTSDADQAQAALQTLKEYSNHTLANLQDQVNQLNRQLKSLPPHVDASSIKREISELVRVVADLVPKRDLQAVATDLREVQQRQTAQLQIEETLRRDLQDVNQRLQSVPDVPHLRSQIEESFTHQIRTINRQLRTLYSSPELRAKIEEVLNAKFGNVQALIAERLSSSPYDLVFDLSAEADDQETVGVPGSRKALMDAIDKTQERLILIWPWSAHTDLDGELMRQFERFLKQKRRLDVGWCHVSDRQHDRFLSIINRRWAINPLSQGDLQNTLKRLLALKRHYPDSFRFKVLGTAENFLISDQVFAILGLDAQLQTQTVLRNAELKLRTTDQQVIQQLIQRFDEADPHPHDTDAYWNRAVTRYDLGDKAGAIADLNKILAVMPDDPAVYNLRGIIRYEQKDLAGALEDLNESIALNPEQHAVYCNRGYLHSETGDQYGAIADFSLAIQAKPDSAIALFYRGAASQKLEDYEGAIADYTDALTYAPMAPVVLYQRGMVYQTVGRYQAAIADLDQAAQAFATQGSTANARKAQEMLAEVRQWAEHDAAGRDDVGVEIGESTAHELDHGITAQNGDRPMTVQQDGQETMPIDASYDASYDDGGAIDPTADAQASGWFDGGESLETHQSEMGQLAADALRTQDSSPQNSSIQDSNADDSETANGEESLDLFGAIDFADNEDQDEDHAAGMSRSEIREGAVSDSPLLSDDSWQNSFESFPGLEPLEANASLSPAFNPAASNLVDHSVESIVWEMNNETGNDGREGIDSIDSLFGDWDNDGDDSNLQDDAGTSSQSLEAQSRGGAADIEVPEAEASNPSTLEPEASVFRTSDIEPSEPDVSALESAEQEAPEPESPEAKAPEPESPERKGSKSEASEPKEDILFERPESRKLPDETDTQQIGTQTLTDFFSAINGESLEDGADPALFISDDFLSLPEPEREEDADEHHDAGSFPLNNEDFSTPAPDAQIEPSTMPGVLDDLFSDAADHENGVESIRNGSHGVQQTNPEQPDTQQFNNTQLDHNHREGSTSLNADAANTNRQTHQKSQSFQTVDEESLADFCQRFTF